MSELKPCPFCGKTPYISEKGGVVCCSNLKCDIFSLHVSTKAWNTRTNDAKWISVEDELPKHMEHVVLRNVNKWFSFIDDNVTHTGCLVEMLGRRHWSVNGVKGAQLMNEFTHWMPLPKQSSEGE